MYQLVQKIGVEEVRATSLRLVVLLKLVISFGELLIPQRLGVTSAAQFPDRQCCNAVSLTEDYPGGFSLGSNSMVPHSCISPIQCRNHVDSSLGLFELPHPSAVRCFCFCRHTASGREASRVTRQSDILRVWRMSRKQLCFKCFNR